MRPSILALLWCATYLCEAQQPDPRAFGFSVARMPDPAASPRHCIRSESTYSIVVYGDNYLRRKDSAKATYRIHGIDREFDLASLQKLLTDFYRDFPVDAKVADPRLGGLIPLPNIIYLPYGWNEPSPDGHKLVDTLSVQYGVGLFHCEQNSFLIDVKESKREGVPTFDQACRDYYLSRLTNAATPKPKATK